MNKKQFTIKIISVLIVVIFVVSIFQFALPKQASAVVGDSGVLKDYWSNPNQINPDDPYRVTMSKVLSSGVIQQVVGCTGTVSKIAEWMLRWTKTETYTDAIKKRAREELRAQLESACKSGKSATLGAAGSTPQVNNLTDAAKVIFEKASINKDGQKIKTCLEEVKAISSEELDELVKTNKKLDQQEITNNCLAGIASTLAKNQLTAMTRSAVNWVNSGYGGNPFYVQNMTNFTNNISKDILQGQIDILTSKDYANPYAFSFANSAINSYKSGRGGIGSSSANFLNGLQSDLGAFITDPKSYYEGNDERSALQRSKDVNYAFSNDFSTGGWDGWLALTQRDQNNPLGFTMLASEHLAQEQARKITETKEELAQNDGFLSQKVCVKWQLYEDDGKPMMKNKQTLGAIENVGGEIVLSDTKRGAFDQCWTWKTITPGSIIKDKTTNYLNSPERQLELADTINESLNALFSILISKLEGSGLSGLSDSTVSMDWTDSTNGLTDSGDSYDNSGAYSNFNLTRDLGNTYIHETTYKVGNWNASTNITNTGVNKNLYPDMGPVFYDDRGDLINSNTYFTVTTAGNTKLIKEGYNGWAVGDRAFWNGSEWQNWKKDQTNPIKNRGVIQIQQDYIVAAKEIMKVLPSIMTKLGELDYCIPGPNPSYKTNSTNAQSAYQDWIGSIYVGIMDSTGDRHGVDIDKPGDSTYDNLQSIYDDNPRVWDSISNTYLFKYLTNEFSNICNSYGFLGGIIHPWNRSNCNGNYFYEKNGNLNKEDTDHLAQKTELMNLNQNYVNYSLFQNFYEVFDKMMNKLYFKNITSVYNESENKSINPETDKNKGYIPMAESGLELTKNMYYYNDDITKVTKEYTDAIAQAKINIAKLDPIKAEVSQIIKAAQARRDTKLMGILKEETLLKCKAESEACLRGVNVPVGVSQDDLGEYCLAKRNQCEKTIMTEAQYKAKYAGCLDEEDIQVFDVDDITNTGIVDTERCTNKADDDLDGLVDSKDPDCAGDIVIPPAPSCKTDISSKNTTGNSMQIVGRSTVTCENVVSSSECAIHTYFVDRTVQNGGSPLYDIYSCNWQ